MQKFDTFSGVAAPLQIDNVDTDRIIPARFLKTIKRSGLGTALLYPLRYHADGSERPDFVLNQPRYRRPAKKLKTQQRKIGSYRAKI